MRDGHGKITASGTTGGARSGAARLRSAPLGLGFVALLVPAGPAGAQIIDRAMDPATILNLALVALTLGAAMITAVWLIRQKAALVVDNDRLRADLADARNDADIRAAILASSDQLIVAWRGEGRPEIAGSLPPSIEAGTSEARLLDFAAWMSADDAILIERAIDRLKKRAEPFRHEIELLCGDPVEVVGRTIGALAVLRFSPLVGVRAELAVLRIERARADATIETMQRLFDAAPIPIWLRAKAEELIWVNAAYAKAVEAADVPEALARGVEFLNEQDRAQIGAERSAKGLFRDRLSAVVEADRRNFIVVDAAGPIGSAGLAVDVSDVEAVRLELRQTVRSHSETLDHLTTAVARFDEKTQLVYHNAAFQRLFDLSDIYLEGGPDHVAILDRLRSAGILPDDRPLRDIKNDIMAAYRATEPTDAIWHLADGRTLRVFASPEPLGGATWVFEDLTEKFELESRLNALVQLQGETLDYLNEAVAVFGQDGRLRLSNPIFAQMWGLSTEFLQAKPHIRTFGSTVANGMAPAFDGRPTINWTDLAHAVTAFDEGARDTQAGEFELTDGSVHSYGIVPLPNGQTMLTFTDISAGRKAERMLRERNEALEQADRMKSDFVQHVNYELRSPLTNIIGFSALLRAQETGPLNDRQSEYLDYISTSTSTLLTIVNDILDLATIDAGIMDLDVGDVDIARTVELAADAVRERLRDNDIDLSIDVGRAGTTFRADGHRVTQILFNLLSNAANFAPSGSTISLRATRLDNDIVFKVSDEGPGMSPAQVAKAFQRFEADPAGGRHSGAGLGLSIVKSFVELHGGRVEIVSPAEGGATVICRFPARQDRVEKAAE